MISAAGKRPNDLRAGAVETAILAVADYFFDGKFGHGGDASGVFFMVRDLAWLSRFTGRGFSGHGFAGFRSRICGVEVTDLQVRAYVTNMWGRRSRFLDAEVAGSGVTGLWRGDRFLGCE